MDNKTLTPEEKKKIVDALTKRKSSLVCPMCQHKSFIMADGYFNNVIHTDPSNISFGGPSIPTIAIVCENCGFVSQHALGVLKLLPQPNNPSNESGK